MHTSLQHTCARPKSLVKEPESHHLLLNKQVHLFPFHTEQVERKERCDRVRRSRSHHCSGSGSSASSLLLMLSYGPQHPHPSRLRRASSLARHFWGRGFVFLMVTDTLRANILRVLTVSLRCEALFSPLWFLASASGSHTLLLIIINPPSTAPRATDLSLAIQSCYPIVE